MTRAVLTYERVKVLEPPGLLRAVLVLALPALAEQVFNFLVGLNDTWLANNLPREMGRDIAPSATAAVGTISYLLWFIGLIVSAVGTGSTALISRAKGARHKRLGNSVCGQSVAASLVLGILLGAGLYVFARPIVGMAGLSADGRVFAFSYLRMLAVSLPFMTVLFVANACLRGAGDALTPAIAMVIVNVINMALSFGLTYGWWGLPKMGFNGIAAGDGDCLCGGRDIAVWGADQRRGGLRLHWHRLYPHWHTLKRIFRIGIPAGVEGLLIWVAQFTIVVVINKMDSTSVTAAAHLNAVKIEAFSYLPGWAFATAAATLVGQAGDEGPGTGAAGDVSDLCDRGRDHDAVRNCVYSFRRAFCALDAA